MSTPTPPPPPYSFPPPPSSSSSSSSPPHFVLFPFMSKGHTIPQLYLARLLSHRDLPVTILTTPANAPFLHASLAGTTVTIKSLPFPQNIDGVPPGVENSENLPSMNLFPSFASSTELMQTSFERVVEALMLRNRVCVIYDFFLHWIPSSAEKLGFPALIFDGMSNFTITLYRIAREEKSYLDLNEDEPTSFPTFPRLKLAQNDFEKLMFSTDPNNPWANLNMKLKASRDRCQGILVNSFYQLEPDFHNYWNAKFQPKAWCVGPLCLARSKRDGEGSSTRRPWIEWLDQKEGQSKTVLYISFGSQSQISPEQVGEIATGLEESGVSFLWVVKKSVVEYVREGFEEKVEGRGMVVKEWVDQIEILEHQSVQGSLSHCGWNSVTESICAGKPILAMPMWAEQHMNARMVVDEFGIGLRVPTIDGTVRGFVGAKDVKRMVQELMSGEEGKRVRSKVKEMREVAVNAVKEGGSSWCTLNQLINEVRHGNLVGKGN